MRQQNKFAGRYRSQERGFFTEAQFPKFGEMISTPGDQGDFVHTQVIIVHPLVPMLLSQTICQLLLSR